ncbi:hypothetical protein GCM10023143_02080 [Compostibacter hankyongensis]|uniref:Phosphatase PAP2 family protein n=2 Tax=Compostibacter hankyongensis TaxID=1007089 RepID=A0ABP8FD08_9BACT
MPLYGTLLIVWAYPYHFAAFTGFFRFRVLGAVILNTILFPCITALLLKALGFIQSVYMRTQRDRIIPYAATMIFYFWIFYVFRHQKDIPQELTAFMLGNFIAIIIAFLCNIFMKISMHLLGAGGLLGMGFTLLSAPYFSAAPLLMALILLAGVLGTCRLLLGAHSPRELYWGLMAGIVAQLMAVWII